MRCRMLALVTMFFIICDQDGDSYTIDYVYSDDDGDCCLQSNDYDGNDFSVDELLDELFPYDDDDYVYVEHYDSDDDDTIVWENIDGVWYYDDDSDELTIDMHYDYDDDDD